MYLLLTQKRLDQNTQKKIILNKNLFLLYFLTLLKKVEPILAYENDNSAKIRARVIKPRNSSLQVGSEGWYAKDLMKF